MGACLGNYGTRNDVNSVLTTIHQLHSTIFLDSTYFAYAFLALNCAYFYSWRLAFVLKLVEVHTTYNTNWSDANFHKTLTRICRIAFHCRFAWIAFPFYCRMDVNRNIVISLSWKIEIHFEAKEKKWKACIAARIRTRAPSLSCRPPGNHWPSQSSPCTVWWYCMPPVINSANLLHTSIHMDTMLENTGIHFDVLHNFAEYY